MRSFRRRSRTRFAVYMLLCFLGVACAARRQDERAANAPSCAGTRTVVVHNGTRQSLELVLKTGGSGQVLDVVGPGQRSTALPLRSSDSFVYVREQAIKRVFDSRDLRVRYEYGCEN
jgi:hypothetical protein